MNVPERVSRIRGQSGVSGVLRAIAGIRSTASKTTHYKALLETDNFNQSQIDAIARSVGEQLASSPSDLRSVLDLMLPGRSGFEVLRDIKARKPSLPVVILTAKDAVDDRVAGLESGADD